MNDETLPAAVGARLEPGVRPRATDADVREVRMPTTLAEAEAMMRVASHWLEAHAPETLHAMLRSTALAAENNQMRDALTELRDRIKRHPAYASLTEDEECELGGDTAELSYLARVADSALDA